PRITGSALVALGAGFALLAIASARFTSQPQPWALVPGLASMLAGVVVCLMPSGRAFDIAGWIWPLLLAALVVFSVRGARPSLARPRAARPRPPRACPSSPVAEGAASTPNPPRTNPRRIPRSSPRPRHAPGQLSTPRRSRRYPHQKRTVKCRDGHRDAAGTG